MMKKYKFLRKKVKALSLTELLVVMVIIGVLVMLALPNLMPLVSRAKGKEAEANLVHIYNLEKTFHMEKSRYTDDLLQIGFEHQTLVTEDTEKGKANYLIEITEASPSSFTATATAVLDFDGDGQFNKWQIDQDKNLIELVKD